MTITTAAAGSTTKRVLVVAFHFAPENTSGTHRLLHFARGLVDGGIDVTVLTRSLESLDKTDESLSGVFPWPDRIVRLSAEDTLLGRAAPTIKRMLHPFGRREGSAAAPIQHADTVSVLDPAGPGSHSASSRFSRTRTLLDRIERLPDVHKGWFRPAIKTGRELFSRKRFDLVVASGPPWTCLRVGAALATENGVPFIADFRDPWTRLSGRDGFSRGVGFDWLSERMESRVVDNSSLVLTNTPGVAEALEVGHPGFGLSRIVTILNGSDARRRPVDSPFPSSQHLVARHFGSLYAGRSISPLVRAAALRKETGGNWLVEQYGTELEKRDLESLPSSVRAALSVRPTLPFSAAVDRMHEPGILVVIQPEWFARQVPTKLYDYLCTGNPILVLAPEVSATWTVARRFERCSQADPRDVAGIASALQEIEELHEAGRLLQVSTVEDTESLMKRSASREFLRYVEEQIGS